MTVQLPTSAVITPPPNSGWRISEHSTHVDPLLDSLVSLARITSVVGNTVLSEQVVMEANANPTLEQFANGSVKSILLAAVKNSLLSHESMAGQVLQDSKVFEQLAEVLIPEIFARARAKADVSRLEGRL